MQTNGRCCCNCGESQAFGQLGGSRPDGEFNDKPGCQIVCVSCGMVGPEADTFEASFRGLSRPAHITAGMAMITLSTARGLKLLAGAAAKECTLLEKGVPVACIENLAAAIESVSTPPPVQTGMVMVSIRGLQLVDEACDEGVDIPSWVFDEWTAAIDAARKEG